jgi:hypothetical protein
MLFPRGIHSNLPSTNPASRTALSTAARERGSVSRSRPMISPAKRIESETTWVDPIQTARSEVLPPTSTAMMLLLRKPCIVSCRNFATAWDSVIAGSTRIPVRVATVSHAALCRVRSVAGNTLGTAVRTPSTRQPAARASAWTMSIRCER